MDRASFLESPPGKVGIFVRTFDVHYRFPTTNFLDEVLRKNGVNIYRLTLNFVNKVVAFEMLCRYQGFLLSVLVIKNVFHFSTDNVKFTFYSQKNAHVLIPGEKSNLKNWQKHWFWVDGSRVGRPYFLTETTSDSFPMLLSQDQEIVCLLERFIVAHEEFPYYILV